MLTWLIVILAAGTMLILSVAAGYVLGWANRKFHVEVDPRVEQVAAVLPGANCGGCGCIGCAEYAAAVVGGTAPPDKCPVGGPSVARKVAELLGLDTKESYPYRAVVHCGATWDDRLKRHDYVVGEPTCTAANLVAGVQGCTFGCLGLGDCAAACKYDAIHIIDGLATVDYHKCIGCAACHRACPRRIISMVPFKAERMLVVACCNLDFGKDVKAACKVGCIGCKACARFSALFAVENNLSRLDYDRYDPDRPDEFLDAYRKCPMKRLVFMGKPSAKDLAATAGETLPPIIKGQPQTTVDKTQWRG